jgi:tRNA(adenine34) deaminase
VFDTPSCHHRPEVVGGVQESEAAKLLRNFFGERR